MAIIIEGAFKLEQCGDDSLFWDLSQRTNVKHKDGSVTSEYKIRGYGMTLSQCVNKIIIILTSHRCKNISKFKEYLETYKEVATEVMDKFSIANLNSKLLNNLANEKK